MKALPHLWGSRRGLAPGDSGHSRYAALGSPRHDGSLCSPVAGSSFARFAETPLVALRTHRITLAYFLLPRASLIQQCKREAEMVLVRAGARAGFGEFLLTTVADGENIVE